MKSLIQIFEDKNIRTLFDEEMQMWFFSVVDVCGVLTESQNPRNYWNMLKARLKKGENELYTNCVQLKMLAPDGKMRETDAFNIKSMLRVIQEIPSKKAKDFRIWLTKVAGEKIAAKRQARLASAAVQTELTSKTRRKRNTWLFVAVAFAILTAAAGVGLLIALM